MLLWIRVNTLEEFMALVFAAAVTTKDKGDKMKTVKGLKWAQEQEVRPIRHRDHYLI